MHGGGPEVGDQYEPHRPVAVMTREGFLKRAVLEANEGHGAGELCAAQYRSIQE